MTFIGSVFLLSSATAQTNYRFSVVQLPVYETGVPEGMTRYQVYVHTETTTDAVVRIFANDEHPGSLQAPDGLFNASLIYGPTPEFVSDLFPITGQSADSWVSIGLTTGALNTPDPTDRNVSLNVGEGYLFPGTWAALFSPGSDLGTAIDYTADSEASAIEWYLAPLTNGSWPSNAVAGSDRKVLVAQMSSTSPIQFTLSADIYVEGSSTEKVTVSQHYNGSTMGPVMIDGCTDENACNYYELATSDNGSCAYPSTEWRDCDENCFSDTDGDGVCDQEEIVGCYDDAACNYNASATDEGECISPIGCETCSGDTDGSGFVVDNDADDDGVCDADEIVGCQDESACNYKASATDNDAESCVFTDGICETCSGETDGTGTVVDNDADNDGVCDANEIVGCQDIAACNYNAGATDSGTCEYPNEQNCEVCSGETDGSGLVLDGDQDDDGICDADEVPGCTTSTACNYAPLATDDDGSCDFCSCGALTGLSDYSLTIEPHYVDSIPGHTTYRIYVNVANPMDFVTSIFTLENGELPFNLSSTAAPNWYNFEDGFGIYDRADQINPAVFSVFPNLRYDSWLTIGAADASEAFGLSYFTIGADDAWASFNAGEDVNINSTAGAFMVGLQPGCSRNPADPNACPSDHPAFGGDDLRVLLGQITTTGTLSGSLAVQILEEGVYTSGVYRTAYFTFNGEGSFSEDGYDGAATSEYQNCGCTDNQALNFDEDAIHNDGSCIAVVNGCTDDTACNYDDAANTEDGSCTYADDDCEICENGAVVLLDDDGDGVCNADEIEGCTDAAACNYDATPTTDTNNDLCVFADAESCEICDGNGGVSVLDSDEDGVCDANEIPGCQDVNACNYNASATDSDGSCILPMGCESCSGETDGTGTTIANDSDGDGVCDADEIAGCQDSNACNFNAAATDSDDSCVFPEGCETCSGETDGSGVIVPNDDDGDSICNADEIAGCQDSNACNYNAAATDSDDSCVYADGNCEVCDGNGGVAVLDDDGDGVCNDDEIPGCTDETACNYDTTATELDDSCVFADEPCEICNDEGGVTLQDIDGDGVCDGDEVPGCTVWFACNFDVTATDDDGSCVFADDPCEICNEDGGVTLQDADGDGVCDDDEVIGCQDATACNYNASATDEGVCEFATGCDSCSDSEANDGTGTVVDGDADDDGVCDADEILGCTDPLACNYDSTPTTDTDNSLCLYPEACDTCSGDTDGTGVVVDGDEDGDGVCDVDEIVGCTNALACNYNEFATDNDFLSCEFPDEDSCEFCSGETDGTGVVLAEDADGDGVCDADEVEGCTDPTACNFNCDATDEDGSCTYAASGENCFGECLADTDGDGICDANEVAGCTDAEACNYVEGATDEVTCFYAAPGFNCQGECLSDADNDGVCDFYEVNGCTDSTAANYVEDATEDDGSCVYQTLEEAYNEGYAAGYEQGFQEGDVNCTGSDYCGDGTIWSEALGICVPESCVGDLDASGVIGTSDLLIFLNVFGQSCE